MTDTILTEPVELTLEELEYVSGGHNDTLVNVGPVTVKDINIGVNANVLGRQGVFQPQD